MNQEQKKTTTAPKQTFDGGVTEEAISGWKSRYKKVIRIDVLDGEELHVGYFHRPNMAVMSAVTKLGKTDEVAAAETLAKNCWLGGDEQMMQDAILFMAMQTQLAQMISGCMSSLKNL